MKAHALGIVACLLCTTAQASVVLITLDRTGTNDVCVLDNRQVTLTELSAKMRPIAALSTNLQVHVRATPAATATHLMQVVTSLRDMGLRNIVIWWQGERRGKTGWILVPCQTSDEPVSLCIGEVEDNFIGPPDTLELQRADGPRKVEPAPGHVPSKTAADGGL